MKNKKVVWIFLWAAIFGIGVWKFGGEIFATIRHDQTLGLHNENNNVYGIGSVSKMFTTAAIMKLKEEGKIDLDKPLIYYIDEFYMSDGRYNRITPRMLLNHSSGIMGTTMKNIFIFGDSDKKYHDTFLSNLKTQRLKSDPGTFGVYCNDGFMLAELLIEKISGMSYSEYIRKNIFTPLQMNHTFTLDEYQLEQDLKDTIFPLYYRNNRLPEQNVQSIGSGGIYSSTEDLCRFSQMFFHTNNPILSKSSILEMEQKAEYSKDFNEVPGDSQFLYGLGWDSVNTYPYNQYGIKALSKGGSTNGYYSSLTVLPEHNISISVSACGGDGILPQLVAQDILLEVLKEEGIISEILPPKDRPHHDAQLIPEEFKKYQGYYLTFGMLKIEFINNTTMRISNMSKSHPLEVDFEYIGNGEFLSLNGGYFGAKGLVESANGNTGFSKVHFSKESKDNIYILGNQYSNLYGIGESALAIFIGQKTEQVTMDSTVKKTWEKRIGKKYFYINEKYNSSVYLENRKTELNHVEEMDAYIWFDAESPCKILSENYAKSEAQIPGMVGRDLRDYVFYNENGVEFLKWGDSLLISEDSIKSSKELEGTIEMDQEDDTKWFGIEESHDGKIITIEVPQKGAYYLYDKNQNCISSSILKGSGDTITLPLKGYLLLAGEKGSKFVIE